MKQFALVAVTQWTPLHYRCINLLDAGSGSVALVSQRTEDCGGFDMGGGATVLHLLQLCAFFGRSLQSKKGDISLFVTTPARSPLPASVRPSVT